MLAPALLISCLLAQSDGFEPIFNGFDLDGWSGDRRYWSVEDGLLVGRSTAALPLEGNTYLFLDEPAQDFELLLEFRIVSGNSGVQYRSRKLAGFDADGYQADLEAGPTVTGGLYDVAGRGPLAQRGQRVLCDRNGGLTVQETFADAAELQAVIRAGDWNEYRIVARGPRLVHQINHRLMADVTDHHPERGTRSGQIALQLHGGAPMRVEFRRLRLRRFESGPDWIWSQPEARDEERCVLARNFQVERLPERARLLIACDNHYTARLNGAVVGQGDDWQRPGEHDARDALKVGDNLLEVECQNDGGPAALAVQLAFSSGADEITALSSDATWWSDQDGSRSLAHSLGACSDASLPWAGVFPPVAPLPPPALTVPLGFEAREVCSSEPGEGSWITLAFDQQGRILAAREEGGLVRITLHPDGVGKEVLELFPGPAQGLLAAHGGLYVNVSSSDPEAGGLFFFPDADGDGQYESSEHILKTLSDGEHGAHAVVLGPDGALYLMEGNMCSLPDELSPRSPHRNYAEDLLLERAFDPNGHALGILAPGASVLRLDAEHNVELIASGQRNPYDLAFNKDGELFTWDADMEWDIGLPWYRPTRITHVVSGAEFGWRSGSGKWPADFPDSLPPVVDIGPGSPTGVTFATNSGFPSPWRDALFVGDWSLGRILAVHLQPRGASYTGTFLEFARATPLNVTGLEFGPDGALYVVTGGRGTSSTLYRVAWSGPAPAASPPSDARAAESEELARKAREIRRVLERDHRREDPGAVDRAWPYLGHGDRHLRYAARIALERQPFPAWRARALSETDPERALGALLAAARVGAATPLEILESLERRPFDTLSARQHVDELRIVSVALIRSKTPLDAETRARALRRYLPAVPPAGAPFDRGLFDLLLYLEAPSVIDQGLARLRQDGPLLEPFHIAFALRARVADFSPEQRAGYVAFLDRAALEEGGESFSGYLKMMREALPESERATPAAAPVAAAPAAVYHHWTLEELLPNLSRAGRGRSYESGRAAFQTALCAQCHRFDGQGGSGAAPDLTNAGGHFNRRDLLEAIIEPSKVINDQYRTTALFKKDGGMVSGQLIEDGPKRVVVRIELISDTRIELDPAEIRERRSLPVSLMPPALIDTLGLEQILDLIAYIESGGRSDHPAFR